MYFIWLLQLNHFIDNLLLAVILHIFLVCLIIECIKNFTFLMQYVKLIRKTIRENRSLLTTFFYWQDFQYQLEGFDLINKNANITNICRSRQLQLVNGYLVFIILISFVSHCLSSLVSC